MTAVAPKNPQTNIHVNDADVNQRLFTISREALAVNRYNDEQMKTNDSWRNNKYADQNFSMYH